MPVARGVALGSLITVENHSGLRCTVLATGSRLTATITRFVFSAPSQMVAGQFSSRHVT